ncbi:HAMP domain-containing protein [Oscillibacter hominis]|uniref:histidine kinase n=1 Tax=Oscillibacter hominis TaxID=2763056 RepID=A0A7G9B8I1_9FIRM|nr:HAMP domain-containing protein [Oscillibacter hominis]
MDKIRGSLTIRIFLLTTLILAGACAATYIFLAWATPITYQTIAADDLWEKTERLVNKLQDVTLEESGPLFDAFLVDTGAEVVVTDAEGNLVDLPVSVVQSAAAETGSANLDVTITGMGSISGVEDGAVGQADGSDVVVTSDDFGLDGLFGGGFPRMGAVAVTSSDWNMTVQFAGDDAVYELAVVSSLVGVNQTLEAIGRVMPYLFILVLTISLLGAVFYSRYITRPIVRLSGISQKMAELDFSWKCGEQRQDEIGILGRNLDELSERLSGALSELRDANAALQEDIDRQRELERQRTAFFAAASHELKTPITILKGQLSGMLGKVDVYQDRDKYLARSLRVAGRMETLIQEMLTVSRMEKADGFVRRNAVDLSALVRQEVEQAEDLAAQREQTLSADLAPGLIVEGDGTLLRLAVSNLLTNALSYSPSGASTQVRLQSEGHGVLLCMENSGVHIPEQALPHLCEAFYRVEESRNRETGGSGLGLYLVKMIVERHHASFAICNTESGVRADVLFPQS